ncbi:MAG: Na+:solute symporter [Thermoflavifilum sp.]|nr:Na+:solute symporter [Thermoflavifilum sp.]
MSLLQHQPGLHLLDGFILITYLTLTLLIGWAYRYKARRSKESYLLAGKKLPWYVLGLSNASDMFDVSGTMWLVSICFVYGFKSIWLPWLWPVFNQVFMMMYLSQWLRKSNVTTGAEWLQTRFGKEAPFTHASHITVVVFALITCLGYMAYGFVGVGKFLEIFLPWNKIAPHLPFAISAHLAPALYGLLISLFALFYTLLGGLQGIVVNDIIKYSMLFIACMGMGFMIFRESGIHVLQVPTEWYQIGFGWHLQLDWSKYWPAVNQKIQSDGYEWFGIFFMLMLWKGIMASMAGPAPNYDMQKILSTRNARDAAKMSGSVSIILLPIRYTLIMSLTLLALLHAHELNLHLFGNQKQDFEVILPAVIQHYLPSGLSGLLLAALLGSFMGTFSSTINAAQAYLVNDIYLKYIHPHASRRQLMLMSYLAGASVLAVGILLSLLIQDINNILQWIVSALYGGYVAANILKWYWWRMNASGFFWGMLAGISTALVFSIFLQNAEFLYAFPFLFFISLAGCIIGSYSQPPTPASTLISFYTQVRPWGLWKPVYQQALANGMHLQPNRNFKRDMGNVILGIIAQQCLALLPMYLLIHDLHHFIIVAAILCMLCLILWKTWWKQLHLHDT